MRAQDEAGQWGPADVLDLDQPSLNAFLLATLLHHGLLVGLNDEIVKGEPVSLRTKPGFRFTE